MESLPWSWDLEGIPKGPGGLEIVRGESPYLSRLSLVLLVFLFALGSMAHAFKPVVMTVGIGTQCKIAVLLQGVQVLHGVSEKAELVRKVFLLQKLK